MIRLRTTMSILRIKVLKTLSKTSTTMFSFFQQRMGRLANTTMPNITSVNSVEPGSGLLKRYLPVTCYYG